MSQFWVVGVPLTGTDVSASRQQLVNNIQQYAEPNLFPIPNYLQVGTIDKLMSLSDDLAKFEPQIGSVAKKIKRTFDDLVANEPEKDLEQYTRVQNELKALKGKTQKPTEVKKVPIYVSSGTFDSGNNNQLTPQAYLNDFVWSDISYGSSSSVEKIKNDIANTFARTEEELKQAVAALNEQKANIANYEKKIYGNLLVRPISQFIKPESIINTPHLTTLILAVPRAKEEEFLQQYQIVEQKYFEKVKQDEQKRQEQEEKEKKMKEEKEAELGRVKAAKAAAPEEEEEEKPPSDEDIKKAQAAEKEKATGKAVSAPVIDLKPHSQYGLSTDARYNNLPTVVPGSAMKLVGAEDAPTDDLTLYRVVCFKRYTAAEQKQLDQIKSSLAHGVALTPQQQALVSTSANVEKFKSICRDYRWTVRPFVYEPQEQQQLAAEIRHFVEQRRMCWEKLKLFCQELFDQVFRAWIHLVAMRAFVEIRLRYGLGNNWLSFVLKPNKNQDKKCRDILAKMYTEKGTEHLIGTSDDGEYFPYVSVTVDLTDM